jgi:glycosyltransferase involved in cell wall biosynthesis
VDDKTERERLKLLLRPKNNKEKNTLIVGLGSVHLRKGVDLFIQTAAEIIKQDPRGLYRFIWFGKSYETDLNWGYDIFLKDQIRRLNLSKHLLLVADTEHLNIVYEEVDFILLTSRLDPLPNVALDGMSLGIPVFCFENATGIAEYLQSSEQGKNCVSPYLDVKSMASNVVRINLNHKLKESIIHENIEISKKYFDFNAYIKNLCSLKSKEQARYEEELECLKINSNSNIDRKYFLIHEFCKKILYQMG